MNKLSLWNINAKLYRYFRNRFPFNLIINLENKSLITLLYKIPTNYDTIIDIGTGDGNALKLIAGNVQKIGVDSCLSMLKNASRNVDAEFIHCDLLDLPIKTEIADLVLIIGVLEYFSDLMPIFHDIFRISKPRAHVIISYSPNNMFTFLRQFLGHKIYSLNHNEIKKLIENTGFQCIAHTETIMQHQILINKT